jgi:hypothetical protein
MSARLDDGDLSEVNGFGISLFGDFISRQKNKNDASTRPGVIGWVDPRSR